MKLIFETYWLKIAAFWLYFSIVWNLKHNKTNTKTGLHLTLGFDDNQKLRIKSLKAEELNKFCKSPQQIISVLFASWILQQTFSFLDQVFWGAENRVSAYQILSHLQNIYEGFPKFFHWHHEPGNFPKCVGNSSYRPGHTTG